MSSNENLNIFISAAEASSDSHGAELLKALRQLQTGTQIQAWGVGGPKLQAAGLDVLVDAREMLVMGFSEVIGKLPKLFRTLGSIEKEAATRRPSVAVVIDYPDFHFRLAKKFKKLGIPVIYYIPPKIWAWRKGRVKFLRRFFTKILCILPFEVDFYKQFNIPVQYVGNPLVDQLPLNLSKTEARKKLGLNDEDSVFVLMPGSRPSELKIHLQLMLDAALQAEQMLRKLEFFKPDTTLKILMPFPMTADLPALERQIMEWQGRVHRDLADSDLEILASQGNAPECLIAADAALVKSGTSTLEAGLLQCPHSIIYKTSRTTAWIFKYLIRYRGPVGLVNLVAGWKPGEPYLVSEILLEKVTRDSLSNEIIRLMTDFRHREKMQKGFKELRQKVSGGSAHLSPSVSAAKEILKVIEEMKK